MHQEWNSVKHKHTESYFSYQFQYSLFHCGHMVSKTRAAQTTAGYLSETEI